MSRRIVILNRRVADLFDLSANTPMSESDLIDAVVQYTEAHNGMQGVAFNYDPVVWRILEVDEKVRLTMANLKYYIGKFIETAEED